MLSFFNNKKRRKDKLKDFLDPDKQIEKNSYHIDINETFVEQSTSLFSQLKKSHYSFIEFIENSKTSLVPEQVFVLEILSESISIGIISKKGVFLDIKYLKKYTYEDLHISYQNIIGKEVDFDRLRYENIENILTIISYEIIYTMPKMVIIVDSRYSDLVKAITKSGRFTDKNVINNIIKKEYESASGYKDADIYKNITHRAFKNIGEKNIYVVSMVEKEYFDQVNDYLEESGFFLKKFHSMKSSLYSSFYIEDKESKMRIHILDNIAYCMQKYRDSDFEYQQFDLEIDTSSVELVAYSMDEVIISGEGQYYEKVKDAFVKNEIKVRTFNYTEDLNRAIIRLEKGVSLDNSFASVVNVAYHELFKINLSSIRLGVSKKMSFYEVLYNNLNIIPFLMILSVILICYGIHFYFKYQYDELKKNHQGTAKMVSQEEKLKKDIDINKKNIKRTKNTITKTENILSSRTKSIDAIILHDIAQKLPDDMILTKIEKKSIKKGKKKKEIVSTQITGKCYHELSLLKFIKNIKIEGKRVFLVSLNDSKITKFKEEEKKKNIYSDLNKSIINKSEENRTALNSDNKSNQIETIVQELNKLNLENKKVYFSDTLNNTFVLEIKNEE